MCRNHLSSKGSLVRRERLLSLPGHGNGQLIGRRQFAGY